MCTCPHRKRTHSVMRRRGFERRLLCATSHGLHLLRPRKRGRFSELIFLSALMRWKART